METRLMDRDSHVNAVLTERRRVATANERAELEREFDANEEREIQKREAFERLAEAAIAEFATKTDAAIVVEFFGRRISIRMDQSDSVSRDTARNAASLLIQFVNRTIQAGVIAAKNTGR